MTTFLILAIVLWVSLAGANAANAVDSEEDTRVYTTAPISEFDADLPPTGTETGASTLSWAGCSFDTGTDYPHRSNGEMSAHG